MKLKIKKNDLVQVVAGNDKGKQGKVLAVDPEKVRVLVEGVNVRKRHMRPTKTNPQGTILEREMPIHYSNVMLTSDGKPSRVGFNNTATGKVRVAKKTGKEV